MNKVHIFRERMAGRSLRQISNDLIKDDISTKRGGKWQANTIKTILENPFYIGVFEQNGTLYKDCHDSVVSEYMFNKVNSINKVVKEVFSYMDDERFSIDKKMQSS